MVHHCLRLSILQAWSVLIRVKQKMSYPSQYAVRNDIRHFMSALGWECLNLRMYWAGANARRQRNKKARDFTDFLTQKSTPLSRERRKETVLVVTCFAVTLISCHILHHGLLACFAWSRGLEPLMFDANFFRCGLPYMTSDNFLPPPSRVRHFFC